DGSYRHAFQSAGRDDAAAVYERERRYLRQDGRVVWVHLLRVVVRDPQRQVRYLVGVLVDISARKRAEDALRANEERLARIVETIADGITIVDRQGRVTFANAAVETIFGRPRAEIVGRHYNDPSWYGRTPDGP